MAPACSFLGKLQINDLQVCFDIANSSKSSSGGLRGREEGNSSLQRGKTGASLTC